MIHREDHQGTAVLRLEHGKANTIDLEFFEDLNQRFDELESAPPQAVVLTGSGQIFSAGVDLFRVVRDGAPYLERFVPLLSAGLRRLFTLPLPVVAAVNGHAIAGGCILAAACDRRVMTDHDRATIGVPELLVGVPFPVTVLEVLRHLLPANHLQTLVTTGRTVGPRQAVDMGLVDELAASDEVVGRAVAAARHYASIGRDAWTINKRQLRQPALDRMDRFGPVFDTEIREVWERPETADVIRAYLKKTVGQS